MSEQDLIDLTGMVADDVGETLWRTLTTREQVAIVKDVLAMVEDPTEPCDCGPDALALLRARIGGWPNVKGYAACLVVGERRRNRVPCSNSHEPHIVIHRHNGSFVWNPDTEVIQWCPGGYQEPVVDTITIERSNMGGDPWVVLRDARGVLATLEKVVDAYCREQGIPREMD